jgi:hypothetical protein
MDEHRGKGDARASRAGRRLSLELNILLLRRFAGQHTLAEKVEKFIEEQDYLAYQLLFDHRGDWREIPEEFNEAL